MALSPIKTSLLGSISLFAATVAVAQDTNGPLVLDPIVIYGDRNAETADETLSSVAIVTEKELDTPTTQRIEDVFRRMGNVSDGPRTQSGFTIRGINSEGLTPGGNSAPLASIYIDGVQQTAEAARSGARGLFDVEQVEVYRGPQSTTSGRNALAGAIYLRSKDPEFERSGKTELTIGEDNLRQVGLAYGDAINENFAFRLSGEWSSKDSDLNFPGYAGFSRVDELTEDEYYNLRGKLLWQPAGSDQTRVLLSIAHGKQSPTSNEIGGPNSSIATSFDDLRGDIFPGIFSFSQDVRETEFTNVGLEVTHNVSDALRFTAQTSVSDSETTRNSISAGDPGTFFSITGGFDQRIASQEFRLNYESEGLRWVAGLYFAKEKNEGVNNSDLPDTLGAGVGVITVRSNGEANTFNAAAFGEVSYEFAPNWRVVAGGRFDYVDQEREASFTSNVAFPIDQKTDLSNSVFLPKLGLEYDIAPNQRVSFVYQQGYRPGGGGIQPVEIPFLVSAFAYEFEEETTDNFELSWRGSFMDGRLNVGANLFYMDWENQQVEVAAVPGNPFSNYIVNAADSESYGAELEFSYEVSDTLDVFGSIGLVETEYKDFTFNGSDVSGEPFSHAPEHTVSLGVNWEGHNGWFANGLVNYVASAQSNISTTNPIELDSYTTVDASVGYSWDTLRVTAYATNLFDERYFTNESGPGNLASLGARREVGVRLSKSF